MYSSFYPKCGTFGPKESSRNRIDSISKTYFSAKKNTEQVIFFSFHPLAKWSGCHDQMSDFFYCESLVLYEFIYWSTRGCNLAAHSSIHASFILRGGWQDSSFLGLRRIECRNFSDILEWGPGAILIGNITLIAP